MWCHLVNMLKSYDNLLQCGTHVDNATATCHRAHYGKTWLHTQNWSTYVFHCSQKRTEPCPQTTQKISRSLDVWFLRYVSRQKNRYADTLITILRIPTGGKYIHILWSILTLLMDEIDLISTRFHIQISCTWLEAGFCLLRLLRILSVSHNYAWLSFT